jgi:hypothetical protein
VSATGTRIQLNKVTSGSESGFLPGYGWADADTNWHTARIYRNKSGDGKVYLDGNLITEGTESTYTSISYISLYSGRVNTKFDDILIYNYKPSSLTTTYKDYECRKYIDSPVSLNDLISDLAFETGSIIKTTNGKYSVDIIYPNFTWNLLEPELFDDTDIIKGTFQINQDIDRLYLNKITARYSYHPSSVAQREENKYLKIIYNSDYEAKKIVESEYEKVVNFDWLYKDENISETINNYLRFFGGSEPIDVVKCQFGFKGLSLKLNDVIRLTYGKYTEKECKVIGIRKNLTRGTTDVILYVYPNRRHSGLYSADTESFPSYLGGGSITSWDTTWTNEQKRWVKANIAFYADEQGYIISGDEETKDLWGYS